MDALQGGRNQRAGPLAVRLAPDPGDRAAQRGHVEAARSGCGARQSLREQKADEAYQEWLRQLRDKAFVEFRLEER